LYWRPVCGQTREKNPERMMKSPDRNDRPGAA